MNAEEITQKELIDEVLELYKDNLIIIKSSDQIKELQTVIRNELILLNIYILLFN